MESKIEKIEIIVGKEMCIEEEIQNLYENYMELVDKTNQIIDYLNSQDQEEICTHDFDLNNRCTKCGVRGVKDMIAELQDTPEVFKEFSDKNIRDDIPEGFVEINGKLHKMEDTTEEWVEGLRKLMSTWGKVLYVNKGRIGKGMQTDMYTRFYKFVKQLLDDREREAYHDGYTDGVTRCMDSLNKLEEDKNEGA